MGTKTNWNEIPPRFRNIDRNIGYYRNSDFKHNYENNFLGKRAPHMNQLVEANNHLMPVQSNLQEYPLYITPVRNYPASPHFHQLHPLYPPQLFPRQQSNQGPMNMMQPQMLSRH